MENMTFEQIVIAVGIGYAVVKAVCEIIEKISNARAIVKAPNAEQNKRLDEHDRKFDEIDRKLANDLERFGDIEDGNCVTQRAILALLGHGIDGNNIDQMQHAKDELQNYLINR